jgi:hypothetical protein
VTRAGLRWGVCPWLELRGRVTRTGGAGLHWSLSRDLPSLPVVVVRAGVTGQLTTNAALAGLFDVASQRTQAPGLLPPVPVLVGAPVVLVGAPVVPVDPPVVPVGAPVVPVGAPAPVPPPATPTGAPLVHVIEPLAASTGALTVVIVVVVVTAKM